MDLTALSPLLAGPISALIVLTLWVKSLLGDVKTLNNERKEDKATILKMQGDLVTLATDIQRSLNSQSGCRFLPEPPHHHESGT